jgi:hypothetical protein
MQDRMAIIGIKNLITRYCYFGYKWKSIMNNPKNLIDYTCHSFFKLFDNITYSSNQHDKVILEGMKVDVCLPKLKIITITIWIIDITNNKDIGLGDNYLSNISICEKYVLDEKNKKTFDIYKFKIIEHDNVFTIMDHDYNTIPINAYIIPIDFEKTPDSREKYINIDEYVNNIIELVYNPEVN